MSNLPHDIQAGEGYAVRAFDVKEGRLASISQGVGHWEDGICIGTCLVNADHVGQVPVEECSCGVWCYWTIGDLLGSDYVEYAKRMIAVVRLADDCIDGPGGTRASAAEIVAWWVADCDEVWPVKPKEKYPTTAQYIAACAATAPNVRRYRNRDVMLAFYPPPTI